MDEKDSLAHAKRKISLSRLEESEICPVVQALTLQEEQDDICLLQLTPDIAQCLTEGEVLKIRGDADETAVLCTNSKTYQLRDAETSNSLLLVPNLLWPETANSEKCDLKVEHQDVAGIFHNYLEMRQVKPSFKKLRTLLLENAYSGEKDEDLSFQNKHTIESLLNTIQSSEEELKKELTRMQACTVNGYIRVLDFDYKFQIVSNILNEIVSNSVPIDKIPMKSVLKQLEGYAEPMEIVEQCFVWLTLETDAVDENGDKLYALDENLVCRLHAEVLLRSVGKFDLQEFLLCWESSLPDGMACDLIQLHGIALTDLSSRPEVIFYFSPDNLPENISERFQNLFQVKEKWFYEEIVPYLEDRVSSINDVKALLLRYARESKKDGRLVYSQKW